MKKVIIDCDVGVDDAIALILAFHSPELEVKAVTGVNGNVPLNQVFENIQKVLSLIHPPQKPLIAKGADHSLKGKPVYAHSVHGKDGLGGAEIELKREEEWWEYFSRPADELITILARQYPNELTLIATGPLTNVALGLQKDPAGMKKLEEISIMGGAVRTKGNITPDAEFNVFSDPLAAQKVFESGLPITLIPLDVTHQVFLTPQWIEERLNPIHNSFSQFIIEAIGYDIIAHRFLRRSDLIYLHDPLAVGVVIDPTLVRTEPLSLDVNIQEGEHYGRMTEVSGRSKIDVCLEVDAERFLDLFLSRLR
jgi:purine nucleosidase